MEEIQKIKSQQQEESNQLLKSILNWRFFYPWKGVNQYEDQRSLINDSNLELYVTANCNQKCEYCYLHKYLGLYPKEFDNPELILKNLEILLKYLYANNFHIPSLDIFSGEIWHLQFGKDIFEMIYKYIKLGLKIDWIIITSNCSFVSDPASLQIIQQYIDKFNEINVPLVFSISIDGKIIDNDSRPRNDPSLIYTDEFYDLIAAFAKHNNFLFHPMISSHNVHKWRENYIWWTQYCEKIGYDVSTALMLLEVRDGTWTDENIQDYCDFIKILLNNFFNKECHGDNVLFTRAILNTTLPNEPHLQGYIPWAIGLNDTFVGCSISNHLTVRLGDLAICPCHRTSYNEYLYGKFIVEDNTITDIKAINPSLAIQILMNNIHTGYPTCSNCALNYICLHGCYGAQIEYGKDPCFPLPNVCKFFKMKVRSIFNEYERLGVINLCKQYKPNTPGSINAMRLLQAYSKLKEEDHVLGII